ncbi:MAG TPA: peptidase C14, partial [Rhodospirillum rubrum]|nr:peptidase C14 [Rhodospirillum rubrum]
RCLRKSGPTVLALGAVLILGVCPASAGNRALLIAIDDYEGDDYDLLPGSSRKDQNDIQSLALQKLGFAASDIRHLTNEQATRDAILAALDALIEETAPGDKVLLQFSGHGTQIKDDSGDEPDHYDEALVPWDIGTDPLGHLIRDDLLEPRIAALRGRDVLVIIDSCNSGSATRGFSREGLRRNAPGLFAARRDATPGAGATSPAFLPQDAAETFIDVPTRSGMRVWSAVAASEVAMVDRDAHQGVFTRLLMEAVVARKADINGNGIISNAEVLSFIREQSQAYCQKERECTSLTPTLEASGEAMHRDFSTGRQDGEIAGIALDALGKPESSAVQVTLTPASPVRLGSTVSFSITSPVEGYLVVFDINAARQITQLFPNLYSEKRGKDHHQVRSGETITIPDASYGFSFQAEEPLGAGVIMAVVTSDEVSLSSLTARHRGFKVVEDPVAYVDSLSAPLQQALTNQMAGRPVKWTYGLLPYSIQP